MGIQNFGNLRYPANVGVSNEYPNFIRFEPGIVKYGGSESLKKGSNPVSNKSSANLTGSILNQVNANQTISSFADAFEQVEGALQNIAQGAAQTVDSFRQLGNAVVTSDVNAIGRFIQGKVKILGQDLELGIKTLPDSKNSAGSINLFLPFELRANSSVDYATAQLGGLGTAAIDAVSTIDQNGVADAAGKLIPGAIQDFLATGNKKAILGVATGQVANNFSFQVFNSVLHRQFNYSFRMMPKDGNESAVIKQICDKFLYFMLPARTNVGGLGYYEVPCQWNISYMRQGEKLKYHEQPRASFLQNVDVQYGGDTQNALFNDGSPMEVTLTLQFVEIEPLYRAEQYDKAGQEKANAILNRVKSDAGVDSRPIYDGMESGE
jgi:hypothetical protein